MGDSNLDQDLPAYLARPVTGERLPATYSLSIGLVGILQRLARERNVPVDALVEHFLFKQLRAEHARRLVGENPDPVPSSFLNDRVAQAKIELAAELAQRAPEERGDKAARLTAQMEAVLSDATGAHDEHIEAVQRQTAAHEAKIDMALQKQQKKDP